MSKRIHNRRSIMKSTIIAVLAAAGRLAVAFPTQLGRDAAAIARAASLLNRANDPLGVSKAETNCGPTPCLNFDESQLVSIAGEHQYAAPGKGDIRGPCPGLNAAANHGYLPRNGIASIQQTITGLGELYGMSVDLAMFLAAYAVALDGDVVNLVWSIGGPLPADDLTSPLVGTGQGISYSHNNYEGDVSIGRPDAYVNKGDAHSLDISRFTKSFAVGTDNDRYTLDKFRQRYSAAQDESIAENPYYFTGAFSTFLVAPAAYNFVINFMSNHSAAEPSGYLNGDIFKTFFAVTGQPGSFKWQRGQERIPENWYRRPLSNEYNIPGVLADLAIGFTSYPDTLKFGGNTGKTNSFLGVNLEDFSGGSFSAANLFEGDNFACFATQLIQQAIPDFINPEVNWFATAYQLVTDNLGPFAKSLSCPEIGKYDYTLFQPFPGYKYKPNGPATNYK